MIIPSLQQATKIVEQIQKADFEGDRAALKHLFDELKPFIDSEGIASKVLYWRGFAMWRSAVNGFNESADAKELEEYLTPAIQEFDTAVVRSWGFVDAKIGAAACRGLLAYLHREDTELKTKLVIQARTQLAEARLISPDNPRLIWVSGPICWNTPPEHGGGQEKTLELYKNGLEIIKTMADKAVNLLDPTWGEPELLMSLAWSNLNLTSPDLAAAEMYARRALEIVPYWHYVRDILLPQINDAKSKLN